MYMHEIVQYLNSHLETYASEIYRQNVATVVEDHL